MEIGPVPPIRPVAMIRPAASAPDLSRVAEAQNQTHSGDDEYTPAGKASRGLEDEEDGAGEEPEGAPAVVTRSGNVSFLA